VDGWNWVINGIDGGYLGGSLLRPSGCSVCRWVIILVSSATLLGMSSESRGSASGGTWARGAAERAVMGAHPVGPKCVARGVEAPTCMSCRCWPSLWAKESAVCPIYSLRQCWHLMTYTIDVVVQVSLGCSADPGNVGTEFIQCVGHTMHLGR
jgi:hypothetical protein